MKLTDNEVILEFMGYQQPCYLPNDWNSLMPVWYKFKELTIDPYHPVDTVHFRFLKHKEKIGNAILEEGPSPSEACKLLAEGIRWYNSTTQNKENSINQTVKK